MTPLVAPLNMNMNTDTSAQHSMMPVYHSQLLVRKDTPYTSLHELQNATFAYNDETSLSGYHSLRIYIREYFLLHNSSLSEHKDPNNSNKDISLPFFGNIVRTGAHVKSVELVVSGGADVLCLDDNIRHSLSHTQHGQHLLSQLREVPVPPLTDKIRHLNDCNISQNMENIPSSTRIAPMQSHYYEQRDCILSTPCGRLGPNPLQPVLVSNRLPLDLQQRLQNAFLDLQVTTEMKQYISADCFVTMNQDQYEFIRYMLHEREDECCALPPVLGPHLST